MPASNLSPPHPLPSTSLLFLSDFTSLRNFGSTHIRVNHSVPLASWPLHYWKIILKGEGLEGRNGFYPLSLPSTLRWGLRICQFGENRVSKVLRQGVLAFRGRKVWCSEDRRTRQAQRALEGRNRKHLALLALPNMLQLLQNS